MDALRGPGAGHGLILDLGCGAGPLSAVLVRRGYEVIGVDSSAAMIRLARKRVPRTKFVRGSIATVTLPTCDAAVAIGEILNYLASPAELLRVLRRMFVALRPGGVFVFDALLPRPKRRRIATHSEGSWTIVATIDESPTRVRRDITTFVRSGDTWRRGREVHVQRLYSVAALGRTLRSVGFRVRSESLDDSHALFIGRKAAANRSMRSRPGTA